jgi:hypothetical protein
VVVTSAATGVEVVGSRTSEGALTNPRVIPLEPRRYDVLVKALAMKGDAERRFDGVVVGDGDLVEMKADFSTGTLWIGATRNGELTDVAYDVSVAGSERALASGRTYTGEKSNPTTFVLLPGRYRVEVKELRGDGASEFDQEVLQGRTVEQISEF